MDGLDFWKRPWRLNTGVDMMVSPEMQNELRAKLNSMQVPYTTLIDDVGSIIRTNSLSPMGRSSLDPNHDNVNISDLDYFSDYQPYDIIVKKTQQLAQQYPDILQVKQYGYTFEGRPIYVAKMNTNPEEERPIILIDGGHHAREVS